MSAGYFEMYFQLKQNAAINKAGSLKTFSLPTNAHNVKKHRVIKTF